MAVRKFSVSDASFEHVPGLDGDVFTGNLVDQHHGSPITIGYGRYGPEVSIDITLAVDDVMVVLKGQLSVSGEDGIVVTAGPGEIVHMPKGDKVTIRAHEDGAITAYVTYPHWQEAEGG